MHSETFATFPNGNWKRSIPLKNHFKTFRKRLQTLISASLFSALGYIPRVLSRVEFGRVLVQLTRITRALFQNIKILRKFPYFYSLFPFSGCSLLCWAIHTNIYIKTYTQSMSWIRICWWSFFIFILAIGCQISHVLRSIQYGAKVFSGSEVSAIFSWNQGKLKPRDFLSSPYPSLIG